MLRLVQVAGFIVTSTAGFSTTATAPSKLMKNEIDSAALLAESTFPIAPADLLERARYVVTELEMGVADGGECLADSFEFCAAVVGPLGKEEYLGALANFNLQEAFPDINARYYGWQVDPLQPNRVWYLTRITGTHNGKLLGKEPTGKVLELPPQLFHVDFEEDGKVCEVGFYTVDRRQGNTGGLGGAFGFLYGVGQGLPFPECQPYRPSFRFRLFNFFGRLANSLKKEKKN